MAKSVVCAMSGTLREVQCKPRTERRPEEVYVARIDDGNDIVDVKVSRGTFDRLQVVEKGTSVDLLVKITGGNWELFVKESCLS